MWETDTREQTRQQATYNKLEEAVLKLEEANVRIAGYERLMHELRTLPDDEAVRLFWRIRDSSSEQRSDDAGGGGGGGADNEGYDWLVGGAGGMSIGEDEYGVPTTQQQHTHQQQLAGELPPPPPPPPPPGPPGSQFASAAATMGMGVEMDVGVGVGVGVGVQGEQPHPHLPYHHHQQGPPPQQPQQQQHHHHHHQAYGEGAYQERHLYGDRHRHH
ncbi:uncharacterized protein BKCO1_2800062 [Diplodia corticola]|uniref:Uncharacterized protein n=1 Tax=Diplodia corticola TaxID=236234 RepID=A0A1J9R0E5_9PEZI|nr:uncharacterized protein BKCO1_2800062 [Diplodia corticola]OJD33722.1 hypothetical protein BKCO1_2800062 [Diplodia corticola]